MLKAFLSFLGYYNELIMSYIMVLSSGIFLLFAMNKEAEAEKFLIFTIWFAANLIINVLFRILKKVDKK